MGKLTGTRYLFCRRGRYFVRVRVPQKVAHVFPRPFLETFLGTGDKATARDRVDAAVAEIKSRFARARQGGAPTREELTYMSASTARGEYDAGLAAGDLLFVALPDARAQAIATLAKMGVEGSEANVAAVAGAIERGVREAQTRWDHRMPPPPMPDRPAPRASSPEALGARLEAWLEQKRSKTGQRLAHHSQVIARSAVARLAEKFPRSENVTKEGIETWCREMVDGGMKPATLYRLLPLWRDYWRFSKGDPATFTDLRLAQADGGNVEAIMREDVPALLKAAKASGDRNLYTLVMLAAYTGMRKGEITALRVEHVNLAAGSIYVAALSEGARKTRKPRTIPIHPALLPLLTELASPKYEFILDGEITAKDGTRSARLGKAANALIHSLGHGATKRLNSLRHTVTNQLLAKGVQRHIVSAILGHRQDHITVAVYGKDGGVTLEQMCSAITELSYPLA